MIVHINAFMKLARMMPTPTPHDCYQQSRRHARRTHNYQLKLFIKMPSHHAGQISDMPIDIAWRRWRGIFAGEFAIKVTAQKDDDGRSRSDISAVQMPSAAYWLDAIAATPSLEITPYALDGGAVTCTGFAWRSRSLLYRGWRPDTPDYLPPICIFAQRRQASDELPDHISHLMIHAMARRHFRRQRKRAHRDEQEFQAGCRLLPPRPIELLRRSRGAASTIISASRCR